MPKRLSLEELMVEARYHGYKLVELPKKEKCLKLASKAMIRSLTREKKHLLPYGGKTNEKLKGNLRGITGDATAIHGDASEIYGNVSAIRGVITGLSGDVSGLNGDCTGLHGDATGIFGNVTQLKGFLKDYCA